MNTTQLDWVQNLGERSILDVMKHILIVAIEPSTDIEPLSLEDSHKSSPMLKISKYFQITHGKLQDITKNRLKGENLNDVIKDLRCDNADV